MKYFLRNIPVLACLLFALLTSKGQVFAAIVGPTFTEWSISTTNSTVTNLASSAAFTGASENASNFSSVQINFKADQNVTIQQQQSSDGSNWDQSDSYAVSANTDDSRSFNIMRKFFRIIVTNNGGSTTTFLRLSTIFVPENSTVPRSLTALGNFKTAIQEPIPAGTNTIGSVTQASGPWTSNITQIGGSSLALGQTTMANSIPVVIASNQSAVSITGTVTANAGTNLNTSALALDATVAALQVAQNSTTSGQKGFFILGATTTGPPTYVTGSTNPLSLTTSGALRTDSSGTTQPISGTVTANAGTNLNTSALALDTTVSGLEVSQGSTTSGQKGVLELGAVTTAAPTYTTGQTSPLSLTTAGSLRTDSSATTQPISGSVTANAGTNLNTSALALSATQTNGTQKTQVVDGSGNVQSSGDVAARKLFTALTDGTNTTSVKAASTAAVAADPSAVVALSPNSPVPTGTNTIGSIANISGTISLPTGAATETTLAKLTLGQASATSGQTGPLIQGSVTTAAPTYTTGNTNPLSLTTAGALRVDGSVVTQPISGTVTSNAGTGNFNVVGTGTAGTPAGGVLSIQGVSGGTAVPISGTVTATNPSVSTTATTPPGSATYIGGSVTTAAPTYTTGQMNALSLTTAGALRTDASSTTQPISGTVTANAGTNLNTSSLALSATQTNGTQKSQVVDGSGNVQPSGDVAARKIFTALTDGTNTTAVKAASTAAVAADPSAVVALSPNSPLPTGTNSIGSIINVSGTVSLPTGAATEATLAKLPLAQGSTTSGQSGSLIQGAVTTASPTYTTAQTSPLSLTTAGALRTDASATTQPISGTVTANAGTNLNTSALALSANQTNGTQKTQVVDGSGNIQSSGDVAARKIFTALTDGTNTTAVKAASTAATASDPSAVVALSPNSPIPTGTNTIGSIANISGTISLPTGAATESSLAKLTLAQSSTTSTQTGPLIQGSTTAASPTYTTATTNPLSLTTAGALRVDGSAVTQPVSGTITANAGTGNFNVVGTGTAGTPAGGVLSIQGVSGGTAVPISGTVTAINASVSSTGATPPASATYIGGSVTTAAPTYTTGQMNALSLTTAGALRTDSSATTQPVSGTVTVNAGTNLNTSALVLDATAAKLNLAQGSTTSTQTGPLIQGAVTTGSPTYTTAQTSPLSLTTAGALRTDSSATTQPISGSLTNISGTISLPTGASTSSNQTNGSQKSQVVDGSGNIQPSGDVATRKIFTALTDGTNTTAVKAASTAAVAADPSVVVALSPNSPLPTGTNTIGSIANISGTISLPTGAATETTLAKLTQTQGSTTSGQSGTLTQGAVTTAAPSYTTAQTSPLSLTTAGALRTDSSATTQPISGTVTATSASVSATGAAPPASATFIGGSVTTAAPTYTTGQMNALSLTTAGALRTDSSGTTQPVSGNLTNISGTISLPTGASTSANQTNGTQKTQVVDGSGNVQPAGDVAARRSFTSITDGTNSMAVKAVSVAASTSGDTAAVVTTRPDSSMQTFQDKSGTGTISALNGTVVATTNGASSLILNITGTWVATLVFEGQDGNGNWLSVIGTIPGSGTATASTTINLAITIPCGGFNQVRVRAGLFTSGSATINYNAGAGTNNVQAFNLTAASFLSTTSQGPANSVANGWPVKITDGTNTGAVKAASTAPASTDPSQVVSVSSNFPNLTGTTGTAVSVGTSSTATVASNANRAGLILVNTSVNRVSCTVGTAVLNSGVSLFPGGTWTMDMYSFTTAAINCIAGAAASNVSVQEFTK